MSSPFSAQLLHDAVQALNRRVLKNLKIIILSSKSHRMTWGDSIQSGIYGDLCFKLDVGAFTICRF